MLPGHYIFFGIKRLSDAIFFLPKVSFLKQMWKSHLQYIIEIRKIIHIVWFIFITGSDIFIHQEKKMFISNIKSWNITQWVSMHVFLPREIFSETGDKVVSYNDILKESVDQ